MSASQSAVDAMTYRGWSTCAQAATALGVQPPPPLRLDASAPLPALSAAHATLLEQLLHALRERLKALSSAASAAAGVDGLITSARGGQGHKEGGGGGGDGAALVSAGKTVRPAGHRTGLLTRPCPSPSLVAPRVVAAPPPKCLVW